MAKSLYISIVEAKSGKSLISLGMMNYLLRKTPKVGYFRPFIGGSKDSGEKDYHIELLQKYFNLGLEYEEMFAFYKHDAQILMSRGKDDLVIEKIVSQYKALEEKCDFVLVEGTNFDDATSAFEFDFNADVAKNLSTPLLLVMKGGDRSVEEMVENLEMANDAFTEKGCEVIGTVFNQVDEKIMGQLVSALKKSLPKNMKYSSVIPNSPTLGYPTVAEVVEGLGAKVLYGQDQLGKQIEKYSIAAMQLSNYLDYIKENALVLTPGDRADIIVGTLLANNSLNYPRVAGICLTAGKSPGEAVCKLIDGLPNPIPIFSVPTSTYQTSVSLGKIQGNFQAENRYKISLALKLFEDHMDLENLDKTIVKVEAKGITPKMFEYNLVKTAKQKIQTIVLPEGSDERILRAASDLLERKICKLVILGDQKDIKEKVSVLGLNLEGAELVKPCDDPRREEFAQQFFELRKHKGITMEVARDLMCDVSYFGTMMVHTGMADGMVSGAAHTTEHTIKPALQIIKTIPDVSIVSSVFFMCLADRVLVYGDCAVNPNPNAQELAEIAIASAKTSMAFGIEPKVAMLSYSSGTSGKGEEVEKVRRATEIVRQKWPELKIEGPIQYDAAVDPSVGKSKMPNSEVAGQASVLIFPDLNTGNNTYKAVQRETGAIAIGPVLQGLKKPVNDLSRGCLVPDVINTVVITAIQSQMQK